MDKATPTPSPASVSLYEQLRSVPEDAILKIDTPNPLGVDTRSIPVGAMCHEAAAEVERDAQDAARYRWLRDGELTADYPYPVMRMGGSRVDDQTIWNDELDAAIDAAMAKD